MKKISIILLSSPLAVVLVGCTNLNTNEIDASAQLNPQEFISERIIPEEVSVNFSNKPSNEDEGGISMGGKSEWKNAEIELNINDRDKGADEWANLMIELEAWEQSLKMDAKESELSLEVGSYQDVIWEWDGNLEELEENKKLMQTLEKMKELEKKSSKIL